MLNSSKLPNQRGKVLLVDASRDYEEGSSQNQLRDSDVEKIASTVRAFADSLNVAKVVSATRVSEAGFNLNISRYVESTAVVGAVDLQLHFQTYEKAEEDRDSARAKMATLLTELGYGS